MGVDFTIYKCDKDLDTSLLPFYGFNALEQILDIRNPTYVLCSIEQCSNKYRQDYPEFKKYRHGDFKEFLQSLKREAFPCEYDRFVTLLENIHLSNQKLIWCRC